MNEESTLLKMPIFNVKEKNFQSWWIKFQEHSRVKGFHRVLKDACIMITRDDIETLEAKPSFVTGCTGARTEDKERKLKLSKKTLLQWLI